MPATEETPVEVEDVEEVTEGMHSLKIPVNNIFTTQRLKLYYVKPI